MLELGDSIIHVDPLGRTKPQHDVIDEVFFHPDMTIYAHGPIIGWVKARTLIYP